MIANREFLGIGWKFPVQVTPDGKIAQSQHEQKIEESIFLILSTAARERPMLADFGCGIHDLVFAPNNPTTVAEVGAAVRDALVRYEPRVDVLAVDAFAAPDEENVLLIRVDYQVRANNARANLVYPFYITEGF
jgi:phage baseplate assembly protein W